MSVAIDRRDSTTPITSAMPPAGWNTLPAWIEGVHYGGTTDYSERLARRICVYFVPAPRSDWIFEVGRNEGKTADDSIRTALSLVEEELLALGAFPAVATRRVTFRFHRAPAGQHQLPALAEPQVEEEMLLTHEPHNAQRVRFHFTRQGESGEAC